MAENILEKIRRLLALATSSNVNEASVAAAKAQELMMRHRISQIEVETADDSRDDDDQIVDSEVMSTRSTIPWRQGLIAGLAKANGCETYVQRRTSGMHYRIVGQTSQTQVVSYMYAYLSREVDRLASHRSSMGRSWLRDFRLGAVTAIISRVNEANQRVVEEHVGSVALARIDDADRRVKDAIARLDLEKARPVGGIKDADAFVSGAKAGHSVVLSNKAALRAPAAGEISYRSDD